MYAAQFSAEPEILAWFGGSQYTHIGWGRIPPTHRPEAPSAVQPCMYVDYPSSALYTHGFFPLELQGQG